MRSELRCPAKLHGVLVGKNRLEIKCKSRFCGAGTGVVVLHIFDTTSGELVETKQYNDPIRRKEST